MNWLTISVIILFLGCMLVGLKRGLVKSVCSTVLLVVALVLAYFIAPIVSDIICDKTKVDEFISDKIYGTYEDKVPDSSPSEDERKDFIDELKIPDFVKDSLKKNYSNDTIEELGVTNFWNYIAAYMARMIINALSFLLAFVLFKLLVTFIFVAIDVATSIPVVHGMNQLGGVAFGVLQALIIVWIAFLVVAIVINTSFGNTIYSQISESKFLTFLYDTNFFLSLVTKM